MKFIAHLCAAVVSVIAGWQCASAADTNHNYAIWEKEISAYERMDATNPPPNGGYEFAGSSTIARWKTLKKDFAGQPVYNRGFGGSEVMDSTHFADRIIFPYAPSKIFFRAGGNDLAAGKSAEEVYTNFQGFCELVHARLPDTEIYYIAWNATPLRWAQHEKEQALNRMVGEYIKERPYLKYIDAYDIALDGEGKPRPELFMPDRLHFNAKGYALLVDRVKPYVMEPVPKEMGNGK